MQVHSWLDGIVSIVLLIFRSLLLCVYSFVSSETFRRQDKKDKKEEKEVRTPVAVLLAKPGQCTVPQTSPAEIYDVPGVPPGFLLLFILLHSKGRRSGLYQSHN